MKANVIRKLATEQTAEALEAAAEALIEREEDVLGVDGEDPGEKLTHVNLALRCRQKIDQGVEPKEAFRSVMGGVRDLLQNDG